MGKFGQRRFETIHGNPIVTSRAGGAALEPSGNAVSLQGL
jgi:hypothetical protein